MNILLYNDNACINGTWDIIINYETNKLHKHPFLKTDEIHDSLSLVLMVNQYSDFKVSMEFYTWLKVVRKLDYINSENFEQAYKEYRLDIHNKLTPLI